MALEAVIYQQDSFMYGNIDHNYINTGLGLGLGEFGVEEKVNGDHNIVDMSGEQSPIAYSFGHNSTTSWPESRRKRRRSKILKKKKEEVERQRMTHIAVERNRRRQINDYLAILRSLMPPSYAQRGDQASIVGGAINFVKGLEQQLQCLEAYKFNDHQQQQTDTNSGIFSNFFNFPQYSKKSSTNSSITTDVAAEGRSSIADIEVTMAESHANIKIQLKRMPKQLLKMVAGFQSICLNVLHLNISTVDQSVLYSFSVKVEEECELRTVNEIAAAVHEMVASIQQDSTS